MILVCGSRDWVDKEAIESVLDRHAAELWLVHGNCKGADRIAASVALKLKMGVVSCTAPWDRIGPEAGPVRNVLMLDMRPTIVIGFHDDIMASLGTKHCLNESHRRGYPTYLWTHAQGHVERYWRTA